MSASIFISGIGTDVGKTVVAAIFKQALGADYWKPIQAGTTPETDTEWVRKMTSDNGLFHREWHLLKTPMSPHGAAALEDVKIAIKDAVLPRTKNRLIVEGAGGLLVPLNDQQTILDLAVHLCLPIILVTRHYLGSINHTLMSLELLKARAIPLSGLVVIGSNPSTEESFENIGGIENYIQIPEVDLVSKDFIQEQAVCHLEAIHRLFSSSCDHNF